VIRQYLHRSNSSLWLSEAGNPVTVQPVGVVHEAPEYEPSWEYLPRWRDNENT